MKTKLFAWASWIPFLMSAVSKWELDVDLPLTPALWLVMAAVVFLATNAPAALTTNSWTDGNGKWEIGANWSAGVPILSDSANVIHDNGGTISSIPHTTTLDHVTELSNTVNNCMVISNLTLSGVPLGFQTLLLTNFTLPNPLKIANTLAIGLHSSVVISNAALQVGDALNPGFFIDDGGLTIFGGTFDSQDTFYGSFAIGETGAGRMTVLGGTWLATSVVVGRVAGSQGTLTIAGGTNFLLATPYLGQSAGSAGVLWLTGGELTTTNNGIVVGLSGVGQMTVSNGTWRTSFVDVGAFSQGTLTIAGGTNSLSDGLMFGQYSGATGAVWLTGGQLTVTNIPTIFPHSTILGNDGVGQMSVSNGTWRTRDIVVGYHVGSQGTLTVAGGTNVVSDIVVVGANSGATGAMWVTGGQLTVTNNTIFIAQFGAGQMTVSNGTMRMRNMIVAFTNASQGTFTVAGGTSLISSNLTVGYSGCSSIGSVLVTGGELHVTNDAVNAVLDIRSGTLTQAGGILDVDHLVITNACGHYVRTGGTFIYGSVTLGAGMDADGDGMPNDWEEAHGLDPLSPFGAEGADGDIDGDGMSNLQEYESGTDPTDSNSWLLQNRGIAREGNDIRITWAVQTMGTTKTNRVYYSTGDGAGGFTNNFAALSPIIVIPGAAGITTTNYLDSGGASGSNTSRYYRVRLVP